MGRRSFLLSPIVIALLLIPDLPGLLHKTRNRKNGEKEEWE
jgi:hypothetical protein